MEDLLRSIKLKLKIKNRDKIQELGVNLWLVKHGLKPSILMDVCQVQSKGFLALIKSISGDGMVLKIGQDYFMFSKKLLLAHLEAVLQDPPIYLDISTNQHVIASQQIIDAYQGIIQNVKFNILNESSDFVDLEPESDWNMCTIFGILLGYPVVYYFKIDQECSSLNNEDLLVVSLNHQNKPTISFSVPHKLYVQNAQVRNQLKNWFSKLLAQCECQCSEISDISRKDLTIFGLDFVLDIKVVNLPYVSL
eukprot:TRINITY_DN12762_c0_g1_i6.p1 TRINITY_DN12762_c0_g1~~TRINITY_DN12762_c0_g1_i6.p1  ORF type:complete len:250 (+),score=24.81 TRINITY_DN12762_c0_g1_i6:590-1339(+)